MKCREVEKRLNEQWPHHRVRNDAALSEHLESCPECAAQAKRIGQLRQLFKAAAVDDTDGLKPMAMQQIEVSARLARRQAERNPRLLRRYALGTITVAALMVTTMLAPWRVDSVSGYELSVGGISVDLADDHERLCDMLFALGAVNAGVDVGVCDSSCKMVIYDLRTRDEARLVEAAIRNLSSDRITVDVVPVRRHSTET